MMQYLPFNSSDHVLIRSKETPIPLDHMFTDRKVMEIVRSSHLFAFDAEDTTIYNYLEDIEVGMADTVFSRHADGKYSIVARENGYPDDTKFPPMEGAKTQDDNDNDNDGNDSDDDSVQIIAMDSSTKERYVTVLGYCGYDEALAKPAIVWNQENVDGFVAYVKSGTKPKDAIKKVLDEINKSKSTVQDKSTQPTTTPTKTNDELNGLDKDQMKLYDSISDYVTAETLLHLKEIVDFIKTCDKNKYEAFVQSMEASKNKKTGKDLQGIEKLYKKIKS